MNSFDFMFYETFKEKLDEIERIFSREDAETFCLELIRYGVRRERKVTMDPYLEATILSMYRLIDKSKEKRDQTEKTFKA